MKSKIEIYRDDVNRGAVLLDQSIPHWYNVIDLGRFRIESDTDDILGQIFGDFKTGFLILIEPLPNTELFSAAEHGFTLRDDDQDIDVLGIDQVMESFETLRTLWIEAIESRRNALLRN